MGPRHDEKSIGGIKLDRSIGKIRETGNNRLSICFHNGLYVIIRSGVVSSLRLPFLITLYDLPSLHTFLSFQDVTR